MACLFLCENSSKMLCDLCSKKCDQNHVKHVVDPGKEFTEKKGDFWRALAKTTEGKSGTETWAEITLETQWRHSRIRRHSQQWLSGREWSLCRRSRHWWTHWIPCRHCSWISRCSLLLSWSLRWNMIHASCRARSSAGCTAWNRTRGRSHASHVAHLAETFQK